MILSDLKTINEMMVKGGGSCANETEILRR